MAAPRNSLSRFLTDSRPPCEAGFHSVSNFYREEFLKRQRCLEQQREYYSDTAITQAEDALSRAMGQIERLCQRDDACEVIGQLLRQIDAVTNLSAWTERQTLN